MIPKFRAWDSENKCWTNYAITPELRRNKNDRKEM